MPALDAASRHCARSMSPSSRPSAMFRADRVAQDQRRLRHIANGSLLPEQPPALASDSIDQDLSIGWGQQTQGEIDKSTLAGTEAGRRPPRVRRAKCETTMGQPLQHRGRRGDKQPHRNPGMQASDQFRSESRSCPDGVDRAASNRTAIGRWNRRIAALAYSCWITGNRRKPA